MAVIGCLGDIAFTVSERVVYTLDNMVWSGSARYATHQRHMNHALTEFTGLDPDKITFSVTLSADLGIDPNTEIKKIFDIKRSGTPVPLTIGTKGYGKYRWNITGIEVKPIAFYRNGDVHTATVSITLQEYLRAG